MGSAEFMPFELCVSFVGDKPQTEGLRYPFSVVLLSNLFSFPEHSFTQHLNT